MFQGVLPPCCSQSQPCCHCSPGAWLPIIKAKNAKHPCSLKKRSLLPHWCPLPSPAHTTHPLTVVVPELCDFLRKPAQRERSCAGICPSQPSESAWLEFGKPTAPLGVIARKQKKVKPSPPSNILQPRDNKLDQPQPFQHPFPPAQ